MRECNRRTGGVKMDADYFKKLQAVPPFAAAATALQTGDLFSDLTGAVTAPVLYSYV